MGPSLSLDHSTRFQIRMALKTGLDKFRYGKVCAAFADTMRAVRMVAQMSPDFCRCR